MLIGFRPKSKINVSERAPDVIMGYVVLVLGLVNVAGTVEKCNRPWPCVSVHPRKVDSSFSRFFAHTSSEVVPVSLVRHFCKPRM